MYGYIFYWGNTEIPKALSGSVADPSTFMSDKQLANSAKYSEIKNFLFFVITPLEWLFYFLILAFGVSTSLSTWSSNKRKGFQTFSYVMGLSFLTLLVFLPFKFYSYRLSVQYGISSQSIFSWLKDLTISFGIDLLFMTASTIVLMWLIRRYGRLWWLYAWLITVPFTVFMMFIQPVVIDPLYNDFYPLKDKVLEQKILDIAHKANIPANHVFEVNMSTKTSALNAYVTGIGSNSRIVLWDTTLQKLTDEEILFVMAHEIGHYVKKDVYQSMGIYLAISFLGLWVTDFIVSGYVGRKNVLGVRSLRDISILPLILVVISILSFLFSPIDNTFSRMQETRADQYALKMTNDPKSGLSSFQKLSSFGLTQVNPPILVKFFRYTHPTMLERLQTMEGYIEEHDDK
ncbi:MAG: family metallopeptidase [Bacillales bacterium]|jgi:Zn-dependent protease with chaperone function|nr:family metallopeptidase [Bacillales bacterium]